MIITNLAHSLPYRLKTGARLSLILIGLSSSSVSAWAENPLYKPSARSPQPIDITTNNYGFSANAPKALELGDQVPDFAVEGQAGSIDLARMRAAGPVVIVFYRGHW